MWTDRFVEVYSKSFSLNCRSITCHRGSQWELPLLGLWMVVPPCPDLFVAIFECTMFGENYLMIFPSSDLFYMFVFLYFFIEIIMSDFNSVLWWGKGIHWYPCGECKSRKDTKLCCETNRKSQDYGSWLTDSRTGFKIVCVSWFFRSCWLWLQGLPGRKLTQAFTMFDR